MNYTGYIADDFDLYIFDLDGTLVDSLGDLSGAVNAMLASHGLPPVSGEIVRRGVGIGSRNLLFRSFAMAARLAGTSCPPDIAATGILTDPDPYTSNERADAYPDFSALITATMPTYHDQYMVNCTRRTFFYPGMFEWLEHLASRGHKLAVLTNKPHTATVEIIRSLGAEKFFYRVAGPESIGILKPDPQGIKIMMKETGISCGRTIMIGDSMVDIETGRNAGVSVCGITGGFGEDADLRAASCDVLIERT